MNKIVGIFPDPYDADPWGSKYNPILRAWSQSIENNGWTVIGLSLYDILHPETLFLKNLDILHIHWTEGITMHFGKILGIGPFAEVPLNFMKLPIFHSTWNKIYDFLLDRTLSPLVRNWLDEISSINTPIVLQIHDLTSHNLSANRVLSFFDILIKKRLYALSEGIATQEESSIRYIFDYYKTEKPYVITSLGDYSPFHGSLKNKDDARLSLDIKNKQRIFSYIGTARPNRNPQKIIRTFLQFCSYDDLLIIAGQRMNKYVSIEENPRIHVTSKVISNPAFRDIICASDFIINDAKEYLTSAVLRTAMSYHIPVIAYPYGAAIDMVKGAAIFIDDSEYGIDNAIKEALNIDNNSYHDMVNQAIIRNNERRWADTGLIITGLYNDLVLKKERIFR